MGRARATCALAPASPLRVCAHSRDLQPVKGAVVQTPKPLPPSGYVEIDTADRPPAWLHLTHVPVGAGRVPAKWAWLQEEETFGHAERIA
jgi:hypothetical protein